MGDPALAEQEQDQRLGAIGAPTQATQLPQWEQNSQGQFQGWADQSQKAQQDAYNQALAQFNGASTPAQQALAQQQGAATGAIGSLAHTATGGARGAAAAAGQAVQGGAGMAASQANGMTQQKLADKYAAADLMSSIANQQRGLQQGEYNYQSELGAQNAAYEQGWNATNDQAALFGNTMQANRGAADIGYQTNNQNLYANQQLQQQQQNMQVLGSSASAVGNAMAYGGTQYGASNQGNGGGGDTSNPYGLGNNPENPWWNG